MGRKFLFIIARKKEKKVGIPSEDSIEKEQANPKEGRPYSPVCQPSPWGILEILFTIFTWEKHISCPQDIFHGEKTGREKNDTGNHQNHRERRSLKKRKKGGKKTASSLGKKREQKLGKLDIVNWGTCYVGKTS